MGDVEDDQRLVDVHFEIAAGAAKTHRDVIGHHLHGDHRERFALGRIDLARHDRGARLILRDFQFRKSGARPARHQANVVGDLVQRYRERAQRSGQLDQRIVGALHGEFVGRGDEGQAGELGDLGRRRFGKAGRRVDARSDRRAAQRQAVHALQRSFDPLEIVRQHPGIAGPFLAQGQRGGVLHVGPPDLDDVAPGLRLRVDRIVQGGNRGNQALLHIDGRRDVHRRRKRIIRRLRHVDVIVGMNRRVAPKRRAGKLAAPVGDHLVDVHVELGAAARHPHMQRKHVVMLAGQDFVAGLHDQLVTLIVEPLAGMVRDGGGFLQDGVGSDHLTRNQILADAEMLERALGLSAPQLVRRHFNHTEAVGFFSRVGHGASPWVQSRSAGDGDVAVG